MASDLDLDLDLEDFNNVQSVVCIRNGSGTKKIPIIKDINMDVPKGYIYGLLGPSGCGKTTLLNCVIGLKKLSSGDAWVLGTPPTLKNALKIGYMPQHLSLYNGFTVMESMRFFARIAGLSAEQIKVRVQFISNLLMLPDVNSKIKDLSGGEQRRVSFAMALLHEPELLILDEPTVGLDPFLRETIWNYFISITKNKSVTVIITTHYIEEAQQADKIGLMRNGTILCQDAPKELMIRYDTNSLDEVFYKVIATGHKNQASTCTLPLVPKTPVSNLGRFEHLPVLLWKNFRWMLKNYDLVIGITLLSALIISLFGLAIGGHPKNLEIGLVNHETRDARCGALTCNSTYLSCHFLKYLEKDVVTIIPLESEEDAELSVRKGKSYASIIIKSNYTESLKMRLEDGRRIPNWMVEASTIDVIYDTSVKDIAYFLKMYLYRRFQNFTEDFSKTCGVNRRAFAYPVHFLPPAYGDTQQSYRDFSGPGVLLSTAFLWSSLITAGITMIERKENILERILTMGVNMIEIVTGHMVSQFAVMVVQCLCQLSAYFVFIYTTLKGSLLLVICFTLMTGLCGMCCGFAISSLFVDERNVMFALIGNFFHIILVSGFVWPLESMNHYLRTIANWLPLTKPIESLRNIFQKGWNCDNPSIALGLSVMGAWSIAFLVIGVVSVRLRKT